MKGKDKKEKQIKSYEVELEGDKVTVNEIEIKNKRLEKNLKELGDAVEKVFDK